MLTTPLTYTVVPGKQEGTVIVTLIGPLVLYNLFRLQDELRTRQDSVVILDLEQTPYMDSAGLGLLMNAYVSAVNGGRAFLLAGVCERVHALLAMTKVDQVLRTFPSVEDAESAAKTPGIDAEMRIGSHGRSES
jgi:anti-sigma B factor antagonist